MAKDTLLEITNDILTMIGASKVETTVGAGGIVEVVVTRINRAIKRIATKPDVNWYTLASTRLFKTKGIGPSETLSLLPGEPDTIIDSARSFTGFLNTGAEFSVLGSEGNIYRYTLDPIAPITSGTLTFTSNNIMKLDNFASSTITLVQVSYPIASDFMNSLDIIDADNFRILKPKFSKSLDIERRGGTVSGTPDSYTVYGKFYRLSQIPDIGIIYIDRYFRYPVKMTLDADESDLPEFCDTAIYYLALSEMFWYKKNLELGSAEYNKYLKELSDAIEANDKIMDQEHFISYDPRDALGETRVEKNVGDLLTIEDA